MEADRTTELHKEVDELVREATDLNALGPLSDAEQTSLEDIQRRIAALWRRLQEP